MYTRLFIIGAVVVIAGAGGLWSQGERVIRVDAPSQLETPAPLSTPVVSSEEKKVPELDSTTAVQDSITSSQPSAPQPVTVPSENTASQNSSNTLHLKEKWVTFGFTVSNKPRGIDTIILHSSYNALGGDPYDVEKIIQIYKDYGVAAHYLIARDGTVYALVKEANIAYHAGEGKMPDGRSSINAFSVGIEMVGTKTSGYTDKQYATLQALIKDIKSRYPIKFVLGHGDSAPDRKTDPWQFDWKRVRKEP